MINRKDKLAIEKFIDLVQPKILRPAVKTASTAYRGTIVETIQNIVKRNKITGEYLTGYMDVEGKFYTIKEALKYIKKNTPLIYANLTDIETKDFVYEDYLKASGIKELL